MLVAGNGDLNVKYYNGKFRRLPAYAVGAEVATVPSSGALAGAKLEGQYYLEVPVQNSAIPQAVLDAAEKAGVFIRDITGHIY